MWIYLLWLLLVIFLILTVYTAMTLSFSVPLTEIDPLKWIRIHHSGGFFFYGLLIFLIFSVSIASFFASGVINFETPLSQPGLFTISTTILLLSNFFIEPSPEPRRNFDAHPLLFGTAVFFVFMAILTALCGSIKRFSIKEHEEHRHAAI